VPVTDFAFSIDAILPLGTGNFPAHRKSNF